MVEVTGMVIAFPPDPDPCATLSCDMQDSPVSACRKRGCGFEWSKTARLDRKAREEQDAEMKEATLAVRK